MKPTPTMVKTQKQLVKKLEREFATLRHQTGSLNDEERWAKIKKAWK